MGLAVATAIRNNTTVITSFYELIKANSYVCTVNKGFVDLLLLSEIVSVNVPRHFNPCDDQLV